MLPSSGFREAVKELTGGGGADVIYDPVGGDVFDESTRCIAFDGRLLVVGFTSGRIPSISVNMPLIKGFSVVGVRAGEYGRKFPEKGRENIGAITCACWPKGKSARTSRALPARPRAVDAMHMLYDRKRHRQSGDRAFKLTRRLIQRLSMIASRHRAGADLGHAGLHDVGGAVAVGEHALDRASPAASHRRTRPKE